MEAIQFDAGTHFAAALDKGEHPKTPEEPQKGRSVVKM